MFFAVVVLSSINSGDTALFVFSALAPRPKFGVDVQGAQVHIHTRLEHSRLNSNKIRQHRIFFCKL
jgi:hypothetical protein